MDGASPESSAAGGKKAGVKQAGAKSAKSGKKRVKSTEKKPPRVTQTVSVSTAKRPKKSGSSRKASAEASNALEQHGGSAPSAVKAETSPSVDEVRGVSEISLAPPDISDDEGFAAALWEGGLDEVFGAQGGPPPRRGARPKVAETAQTAKAQAAKTAQAVGTAERVQDAVELPETSSDQEGNGSRDGAAEGPERRRRRRSRRRGGGGERGAENAGRSASPAASSRAESAGSQAVGSPRRDESGRKPAPPAGMKDRSDSRIERTGTPKGDGRVGGRGEGGYGGRPVSASAPARETTLGFAEDLLEFERDEVGGPASFERVKEPPKAFPPARMDRKSPPPDRKSPAPEVAPAGDDEALFFDLDASQELSARMWGVEAHDDPNADARAEVSSRRADQRKPPEPREAREDLRARGERTNRRDSQGADRAPGAADRDRNRGRDRGRDRGREREPRAERGAERPRERGQDREAALEVERERSGDAATRVEKPQASLRAPERWDRERGGSRAPDRGGERNRGGGDRGQPERGRREEHPGDPLEEVPLLFEPADEIPIEILDDEGMEEPVESGVRQMLINASMDEEVRIAVLHEGRLEELFIERESVVSHVGNIYKGKVTNVEASIQAAFVDFGLPKHGFLHVSDLHTKYFPRGGENETENVGRKMPRRDRPPIQRCLRRGQEVIVQVTKEGLGTKGPSLTTYLSIPGRFLVMMPGMSRLGVSRKIEDEQTRRDMREIIGQLQLPERMGFILRTVGEGRPREELQRDLDYLMRLWRAISERERRMSAPCELYRESDLVIRTLRDHYTSTFEKIIVDDRETARKVEEFLGIISDNGRGGIEIYEDKEPLFQKYGIEIEIATITARKIPLPSGGSIFIDSHEAMVTIDVNSGKFRSPDNAEETALKINLEAAEEITRQLRLRDLGGLVVCDFIDMNSPSNRRKVVAAVKAGLRKHKERARVLNMSPFGLVEITRQRQRPSLIRGIYTECRTCHSTGLVKRLESMVLDVARFVQYVAHYPNVHSITLTVASEVASEILNRKRAFLQKIEEESESAVIIRGDARFAGDQIALDCRDARGMTVLVNLEQTQFPTAEQPGSLGEIGATA